MVSEKKRDWRRKRKRLEKKKEENQMGAILILIFSVFWSSWENISRKWIGVKKYQGQVFVRVQSFDSNIKTIFPHKFHRFVMFSYSNGRKFLLTFMYGAHPVVPSSTCYFSRVVGKMFNLKIWNPCFFLKVWCLKVAWARQVGRGRNLSRIIQSLLKREGLGQILGLQYDCIGWWMRFMSVCAS